MKNLKVRDILRILKKDGWVKLPQKATDHRQFKHPTKTGEGNGKRSYFRRCGRVLAEKHRSSSWH